MPKQPSPNKEQGRKVKCRNCWIDMERQGRLDGGWDWLCLKCGLRWEVVPDVVPTEEVA